MLKIKIHRHGDKVATVRDAQDGDLWVKPARSGLDPDGEFLLDYSDIRAISAFADAMKASGA